MFDQKNEITSDTSSRINLKFIVNLILCVVTIPHQITIYNNPYTIKLKGNKIGNDEISLRNALLSSIIFVILNY